MSAPSSRSGYTRYTWSVTTTPSTASPRNSSRSLDGWPACSAHHERCTRAGARRSGARSRPRRSTSCGRLGYRKGDGVLEPADDVVDGVAHRLQVLEVLVVDAEPDGALAQLLLEGLDQLDERQGVGLEVVGEARPSVMPDGSISRMSARRSRMSSNTCWRSMGFPRSTWVSAGTVAPARRLKGVGSAAAYRHRTLCACARAKPQVKRVCQDAVMRAAVLRRSPASSRSTRSRSARPVPARC